MSLQTHPVRNGVAAAAVAALLAATVGVVAQMSTQPEAAEASTARHGTHTVQRSRQAVKFRSDMRTLWEDHIVWTRQFIVSAVADLPDTDTAAGRLLENQEHIGDAIKPFFGEEAGEALSTLLRDHILIAADLVAAARDGDSAGVEQHSERWSANGDEIADFLAVANAKHWPQDEMRSMMAGHLEWTLNEAVARLNADWAADVEAYDHIHVDILHMADMLSAGIIKQFPGRF
jgi:hypothetical protein